MANRKRIETLDPLAEPMWREAQLVRPEFSEALHARLRSAVRSHPQAGTRPVGPQAAVDRWQKLRGDLLSWIIAAATAIALLVGLALFWHTPRQPSVQTIAHTPTEPVQPALDDPDPTTALVESTATGLQQWMEATVDDNQWAGLDRDAVAAVATVTGPLPFDLSGAVASADPTK